MKKAVFVLSLAALMVLAMAGSAFANFGPHGGYALDTDACAGCHRAHTSFSTLTWEDTGSNDHSALLISSATTMKDFCYACHGADAPGAATNVEEGIFDSGPSSALVGGPAGTYAYDTNSSFDATLNGGGFGLLPSVSSMHDMDKGAVTDPMWGEGFSAAAGANLTCTNCHDPHGSSNYRLLKDNVNNVTVGGYDGETPQPYVFSSEEGYPAISDAFGAVDGGWLKHVPGAEQMDAYRPNYTNAEYQWAAPAGYSGTNIRSMSTWCAACHKGYNRRNGATGTINYGDFESDGTVTRTANGELTVSGVNNTVAGTMGTPARHRHPVDVAPWTVTQDNGWGQDAITDTQIPLEKRPGYPEASEPRGTWTTRDYLGCLTCHRAHGTNAVMTGFANARLKYNASGNPTWTVEPTTSAPAGVNPNVSSSLLRTNNRGVCERCHNK